jgi:hypothetical protein
MTQSIRRDEELVDLGFKLDEFGQLKASGCLVTIYRVGGEWEIDFVLPNGAAIGCDVPLSDLKGGPKAAWPDAAA